MTLIAVIPARMASTRCPGKPLLELCGKPMVQWVYEAAVRAPGVAAAVIATPDAEIAAAAAKFGAESVITSADHPTGTDRIAEAAATLGADAYLNVQGDEPLIQPESIAVCARTLVDSGEDMASVYDWAAPGDDADPNVVKVVTDACGNACISREAPSPTTAPGEWGRQRSTWAYTRTRVTRFADSRHGRRQNWSKRKCWNSLDSWKTAWRSGWLLRLGLR